MFIQNLQVILFLAQMRKILLEAFLSAFRFTESLFNLASNIKTSPINYEKIAPKSQSILIFPKKNFALR